MTLEITRPETEARIQRYLQSGETRSSRKRSTRCRNPPRQRVRMRPMPLISSSFSSPFGGCLPMRKLTLSSAAENGKPAMKPSEALTTYRDELRLLVSRYGLLRPRVFGSVLSGTDTDESDLDLLVDATETTTLFTLAGVEHEAQQLLGVPVTVLTAGFLSPKFRDRVLQQAQPL